MRSAYRESPDRIFIWIVLVLIIDLFISGEITWSRWAILGLAMLYFMQFLGDSGGEKKALTLLQERYAKGELSEEEFLLARDQIKEEYTDRFKPGVQYLIGLFLIFVGGFYIVRNVFDYWFPIPWMPIIVIIIGLFAIIRRS